MEPRQDRGPIELQRVSEEELRVEPRLFDSSATKALDRARERVADRARAAHSSRYFDERRDRLGGGAAFLPPPVMAPPSARRKLKTT